MPDAWTDPPTHGAEREVLTASLAALRAAVERKARGLDATLVRRPMVDSGTSLVGLVRHLSDVENFWFRHVFAAEREIPFYGGSPDDAFAVDDGVDVDEAFARYRRAQADADRIVAASDDLDRLATREHREGERPTLRWILVHVIDETARHAGHADILRELIDGAVGR